jgi:spore maturation protein CgeB
MGLTIVGYAEAGQMGSYLASAATALHVPYRIIDARKAEANNRFKQAFYWRLRGKKPANISSFAAAVLDACSAVKPSVVLTTGNRAPLERCHIEALRKLGAKVINYSTDDPWNPALHAPWFLSAVPSYDVIFTPRRANLDDFRRCGARAVHYMPFGYDAEVHRPWPEDAQRKRASDVLFVGGCDDDRLPLISALAEAGLSLALFGRYWNRHPQTRAYYRGVADQAVIRAASTSAAVCLCLVRRANRDDHVMRSYEAAAIGGCILAEDTPDHRELFGPEDHAVRYFKSTPEMVKKAKILVADPTVRRRLSLALQQRMTNRSDSYADRLKAMLNLTNHSVDNARLMAGA